jgi:O-glycosyl hydrolase
MLTLNGQVVNVFQSPKGVNRDTGEEYGGQDRVQIMARNTLKNGEDRIDLVNLTVTNPEAYLTLQGQNVRVPVGVFAKGGTVNFYVPAGSQPEPLKGDAV